ncbi:MAG: Tetratricopeptide repeat [Verrucomicrobiota bacterium]
MSGVRVVLVLVLLWSAGLSLAPVLGLRTRGVQVDREGGFLSMLLGDGRRLFANHFFAKADAYFHRGRYPTIFDQKQEEELHMVGGSAGAAGGGGHDHEEAEEGDEGHVHDEHCDHGEGVEAGHVHDEDCGHDHGEAGVEAAGAGGWVGWLNGRLMPADHVHLEGGDAKEMLPWLKVSLELDPDNVQAYVTTAYWLRDGLGRVDEAEEVLRHSVRRDPRAADPSILFELGMLLYEGRGDGVRGKNLLLAALDRWEVVEAGKEDSNRLLHASILGRLAEMDEAAGRYGEALEWLKRLEEVSPNPEAIREREREVEALGAGREAPSGKG